MGDGWWVVGGRWQVAGGVWWWCVVGDGWWLAGGGDARETGSSRGGPGQLIPSSPPPLTGRTESGPVDEGMRGKLVRVVPGQLVPSSPTLPL